MDTTRITWATLFTALGIVCLVWPKDVLAVPSFARQTGMSCTVCHTVWPQLTHFGRIFKLDGYTFSNASESGRWYPPVAAMFQASYTALQENNGILNGGAAPFDDAAESAADKFNVPQQASLFYGGKIYKRTGALAQLTYDGTANEIALDNMDIRYAERVIAGGRHLTYGFTIDNNPTVGDLWNSTPAWGFPFASSAIAPAPTAATLIDGGLGQEVGGIGAYFSLANLVYGAVSVYRTTYDGITRPLGAGTDPADTNTITEGAVPYWRLALHHQWNAHSFEIGTYGLKADVYPGVTDTGPTDSFTDYAFDAQYQFVSTPHLFTIRSTWIHEDQDWDARFPSGSVSNPSDTLKTFKVNASYFYRGFFGIIGGCLGYFSIDGDTDRLLYPADPVDGSKTGSPESNGFILQANCVWKDKYQFGLQYTLYDKFNGAGKNYDGSGRDASDNNTIYLFAWLMF
jgi:hypothetical protein